MFRNPLYARPLGDSPLLVILVLSAVALASYTAFTNKYTQHPLSSRYHYLDYLTTLIQLWLGGVIGFAVWKILVYPKYISPLRGLPEPKGGSWWNGHAARIFTEMNGAPAAEWARTIPHRNIFRYLGVLNSERLVTTSSAALHEICTRNYDFVKSRQAKYLAGQLLGHGLVLVDGDEHKRQRKLLIPAFRRGVIRGLYPVFWDKAREVVEKMGVKLDENATKRSETLENAETLRKSGGKDDPKSDDTEDNSAIEIGEYASRAALDVITLAAIGKDFGAIADPTTSLNTIYRTVFEPTRLFQFFALLKAFIPAWIVELIPIKRNLDIEKAAQAIRKTCRQIVREKRGRLVQETEEKKMGTAEKDILSVILRGSPDIGEEGLVDQMLTFLAAGHETVSVGITWAIYMFCVHPEWQTKLREEVRSKLPSPSSLSSVSGIASSVNVNSEHLPTVGSAEIDALPLLAAFLSETLRYWPPIPMTAREASRDTTLMGQFVPKGTKIIVTITGTNRDEGFWGPDAAIFKPERWLKGAKGDNQMEEDMEAIEDEQTPSVADGAPIHDGATGVPAQVSGALGTSSLPSSNHLHLDPSGGSTSKYGFLSFIHGPRNCIGQVFARAEMACIVAAMVGRYEFTLRDKHMLEEKNMKVSGGGFSAKPLDGVWVRAKVVEGW